MIPALLLITLSAVGHGPVLSTSETEFLLDGKPVFLLGASYYGGLGIDDPRNP